MPSVSRRAQGNTNYVPQGDCHWREGDHQGHRGGEQDAARSMDWRDPLRAEGGDQQTSQS